MFLKALVLTLSFLDSMFFDHVNLWVYIILSGSGQGSVEAVVCEPLDDGRVGGGHPRHVVPGPLDGLVGGALGRPESLLVALFERLQLGNKIKNQIYSRFYISFSTTGIVCSSQSRQSQTSSAPVNPVNHRHRLLQSITGIVCSSQSRQSQTSSAPVNHINHRHRLLQSITSITDIACSSQSHQSQTSPAPVNHVNHRHRLLQSITYSIYPFFFYVFSNIYILWLRHR